MKEKEERDLSEVCTYIKCCGRANPFLAISRVMARRNCTKGERERERERERKRERVRTREIKQKRLPPTPLSLSLTHSITPSL